MGYGRVDETFWDDPLMRAASQDARLMMLYLLTTRHRNRLGLYVLSPHYAADDLQWSLTRVEETRTELEAVGRIKYDEPHRCIFIKHFLRHNILENHKVVTGAQAQLRGLPPTFLLRDLLSTMEKYCRAHYRPLLQDVKWRIEHHLDKVSQTVLDIVPDTVTIPWNRPNPNPNPNLSPSPSPNQTTVYPEEFELLWKSYPKRNNPGSKWKAYESWEKAKEQVGVSGTLLMGKVLEYAQWCEAEGIVGTSKVAMATTWLNQRRWEVDLTITLPEGNRKLLRKVADLEGIDLEKAFQ